jgi:phage gp29-like protein
MRTLPDPDPILRRMGRGITALEELLTDSHLESVWSIRCSAASGAQWFCSAGGGGAKEKEAAEVFAEQLGSLDIPRIIEEMMDAAAYGYSPLEVIWVPGNGRWGIGDIVGKPPQWFEFDQENRLVFRTGVIGTEPLPENRFLIARHRPSYANPYGVKVFSKCCWPVTFKKNGFRWWTVFVEKYGGAFMYGKYPSNAGEQYKAELLNALERMIADAVAIAPAESEITIDSLANKGSVSTVHKEYIEASNKEISKAVLGQTLTTDIGSAGSYAAAQAHNLVRQDLAAADRRRISKCFNRLSAVWTFYNYGADVLPPAFEFVKDEDLQKDRAERDAKLYTIGWRPKKTCIQREYEIPEEDFDIVERAAQGMKNRSVPRQFASCPCGCGGAISKHDFFQDYKPSLFASKEENRKRRIAAL